MSLHLYVFVCLPICPILVCLFLFSLFIITIIYYYNNYYYYHYLYVCFVRDRKSTDSDKGRVRKDLEGVGREETIVRIYHIEKNLF